MKKCIGVVGMIIIVPEDLLFGNEGLYKGPEDYYNDTKNKREIVFFGEEGLYHHLLVWKRIKKIWKNIAIKDGMVESFTLV